MFSAIFFYLKNGLAFGGTQEWSGERQKVVGRGWGRGAEPAWLGALGPLCRGRGVSPSWHGVAESAFPNLLVFLSHGWKNQGQRRAACLQTWLPGKLVKGH